MLGCPRFGLHAALLVFTEVELHARADSLLASPPTLPTAIGTASPLLSSGLVEDADTEVSGSVKTFWGRAAQANDTATAAGASSAAAGFTSSGRDYMGAKDKPDWRVQQAIAFCSTVASLTDGAFAQFPGVGDMVVPTIQAAMVAYIGHVYGCHLSLANALSAVTMLASNQAKMYLVGKIGGYVPFAGNFMKATVTGIMTKTIGETASKMLTCPQGSADLLAAVNASNSDNTSDLSNRTRRLFHTISDYLVHEDMPSKNKQESWAREAWQRMIRLFKTQDQAELMAEVANATEAKALAQLLRSHAWNLEAVTAVLGALSERFEPREACVEVDFAAGRFWIPEGANAEAREAVAPYVLRCLSQATPATQRATVQTAARLLVATRGGAVIGLSSLTLRQALQVLEHFAEELSTKETIEVTAAAFAALSRGEAAACGALRATLHAGPIDGTAGSAVALEQLELLDRLIAPDAAEQCIPKLRADVVQQLTLTALPRGTEVAQAESSRELQQHAGSAPSISQRLEEKLSEALVGQRCALERLTRHPGHLRFRLRGGLWGQNRPLVLLLTGPSGTGKTLLARTLGEALLDRPIAELEASGRFRTFHMNVFTLVEDQKSFFGPPKGIVGTGDLPELLKAWPDAVILLDEVEKAHPSFARALLKVFGEHGAVYDPHTGQDISAVNATFVLTSNLGKDLIMAHPQSIARASAVEDNDIDCVGYDKLREDVVQALRSSRIGGHDNFFRESELRGRLTDVLPFLPCSKYEVEEAVRKFLTDEARALAKAPEFLHATLAWTPEVVRLFAGEHARRPEEGLRNVHTQLQVQVRQVLAQALEAKLLSHACTVMLRVRAQRLDLQVVPNLAGAAWTWFADKLTSGPAVSSSAGSPDRSTVSFSAGSVTAGLAHAASGSGWSTDRAQDTQWERETEWDWNLFWEQVHDFIWQHWRTALLVSVAMFAMATIPLVPSAAAVASPAAAAAASAAAASVPAGTAAVSATWLPCLLAVLQFLMPVVSSIPSVVAMTYAWQHRHWVAAAAALFLALPAMRRALYWCPYSDDLEAEETCRQRPSPRNSMSVAMSLRPLARLDTVNTLFSSAGARNTGAPGKPRRHSTGNAPDHAQ